MVSKTSKRSSETKTVPKKRGANKTRQDTEQESAANARTLAAILREYRADRKERETQENRKANRELATIATLIVAAIAALFTLCELQETTKATRSSAGAAHKSAEVAEDSLVKLQRPFVGVQQIRYLSHRDLATNKVFWTFHTIWENSGASPTRNLRFYANRYIDEKDIPPDYAFALPDEPWPITHLSPHGVKGSGELPVSGDDLVAVREGKKFLYLWGRADYRDTFDGTPDHVTKYFIKVLVRGDPNQTWDASTDRLELIFLNQPKHNCADEECEQ